MKTEGRASKTLSFNELSGLSFERLACENRHKINIRAKLLLILHSCVCKYRQTKRYFVYHYGDCNDYWA